MDSEPDHQAEDNAQSGKRKRSPNSNSHSPVHGTSPSPVLQAGGTKHGSTQDTLKRRRRRVTSPTSLANKEAAMLSTAAQSFSQPSFPIEIVHHIMSLMDPFSLARLMSVNRYMYSLLDSVQTPDGILEQDSQSLWNAEKLWTHSRKRHLPGMPHPLRSLTELDMFKLVYGRRCQICGTLPKTQTTKLSTTPWSSGPGTTGVRAIWPFKRKLCARCLQPLLMKDIDLLQQGLSELEPGLLCVSFTSSLHYVMSITLTQNPVPTNTRITKYYFREQVEELVRDAPHPYALDNRLFASWIQQANASKLEAITDTVRLEAWDLSQSVQSEPSTTVSHFRSRSSASGSSVHSDNLTKSHFTTSSGGFRHALSSHSGLASSLMSSSVPRYAAGLKSVPQHKDHVAERYVPLSHVGQAPPLLHPEHIPTTNSQSDHGSLNIQKLKSDKRTDIQRRCMNLDPPIPFDVLDNCPAFHAALQILMPLDENTWAQLRDRLEIESRALNFSANARTVASQHDPFDSSTTWRPATPFIEPATPDLREQAQRPVREKLYDFAREYVHRRYADGFGQTYGSAPQFAADVLMYVRQRFYQNQADEDAAFAAHDQPVPDEGPSGIRSRTLKLEHMRYVFESSIKPFTEFVRKDLFLCSACDTQGRHFAFESIIQHYASRHTDAFSRGAAVVHWKAEWPAQPPFEPSPGRDPDLVTSSYPQTIPRFPAVLLDMQSEEQPQHAKDSSDSRNMASTNRSLYNLIPAVAEDTRLMYDADHSDGMHVTRATHQLGLVDSPRYSAGSFQSRDRAFMVRPRPGHTDTDHLNVVPEKGLDGRQHRRTSEQQYLESGAYDRYAQTSQYPDEPMTEADTYTTSRTSHMQLTGDPRYSHQEQRFHSDDDDDVSRTRHQQYRLDRPRRLDILQQEDRDHSEPRSLSQEHRRYESPRNRSRATSSHHARNDYDHKSFSNNATNSPARNEVERFFDSFDVEIKNNQVPVVTRPSSTGTAARPSPRDRIDQVRTTQEQTREPQHPRYTRRASNFDESQLFRGYNAPYGNQDVLQDTDAPRSGTVYYRVDDRNYDYPFASRPLQQSGQQHISIDRTHIRPQDEDNMDIGRQEDVESYHRHRQHYYTDRSSRDPRPTSSEIRYSEPVVYEQVRVERVSDYDESRAPEVRYRYPTYEQEEVVWDPEARRYYIERPVREYPRRPPADGYRDAREHEVEYERRPTYAPHPRDTRDPRDWDRANLG